jgi:hypothetical protein
MNCLMSAILLVLSAVSATTAPATQPSNTRTAQCTIDIWGEGADARDQNNVPVWRAALLTALAGPAKDLLHVTPDAVQQYLDVDWQNSDASGMQRFTLTVTLDDAAQPAAQEFLAQAVAAIPDAIAATNREQVLQSLPDQERPLRQERAALDSELDSLTAEIDRVVGGPTVGNVKEEAGKLEEQQDESGIEVAAMHAEQEQVAKEITRLEAEAHAAAQGDPAVAELQKIVDLKQEKLQAMENTTSDQNPEFPEKSRALKEEIAEARVTLLEREAAVEQASGGDLLADLRKRMVMVDIDLAQSTARRDAIAQRLRALAEAEEPAARAESVRSELEQIEAQIQALEPQLEAAEEKLRRIPPARVRIVPESELKPAQ